jgi:hypothetical protein
MKVFRLADRNKPVVVYVQPNKSFVDVRTQRDLSALLAELDRQAARRLHADAIADGLGQGLADQPALGGPRSRRCREGHHSGQADGAGQLLERQGRRRWGARVAHARWKDYKQRKSQEK